MLHLRTCLTYVILQHPHARVRFHEVFFWDMVFHVGGGTQKNHFFTFPPHMKMRSGMLHLRICLTYVILQRAQARVRFHEVYFGPGKTWIFDFGLELGWSKRENGVLGWSVLQNFETLFGEKNDFSQVCFSTRY